MLSFKVRSCPYPELTDLPGTNALAYFGSWSVTKGCYLVVDDGVVPEPEGELEEGVTEGSETAGNERHLVSIKLLR
jgi:hypothetical protein